MTGVCDKEKFLDPGSPEAHTIRPGFDGHHVPGPQHVPRTRIHPWSLVNQQSDSVPDAVREFILETGGCEYSTACGIDFVCHDSGSNGRHTGFARRAHDRMTVNHFGGAGPIDHERSRHVGVITVEECPEVDHNRFTRLKASR